MKSRQTLTLAVLLLAASSIQPVQAATNNTYYVSPSGSDHNPGTEHQPWRTIGKAAQTLAAGDTVYIMNGVYREAVQVRASGTLKNPIVFKAYPLHRPIIDGTGVADSYDALLQVVNKHDVEISGLTIQNSKEIGIYVGNSNRVSLRGNQIQETASSAIGVWRSSNVTVDGNTVVNARNASHGFNEMVTVAQTTDFKVTDNLIYCTCVDCCSHQPGIDIKSGSARGRASGNTIHDVPSAGIYLDAWDQRTHDLEVYNNHIYNTDTGVSLGSEEGGELSDVCIYNNLIFHVSYAGIDFHASDLDGLRKNIHVYNNTIVESYQHGGAGILVRTYNIDNVVLENNLINFGPDTWSGQIKAFAPDKIVSAANLTYGPRRPVQDTRLVEITAGTIYADPRFLDRPSQNFRLRSDSPAIDQGRWVDLALDHVGMPRPLGAGYDIGAYEYVPPNAYKHKVFLSFIVR